MHQTSLQPQLSSPQDEGGIPGKIGLASVDQRQGLMLCAADDTQAAPQQSNSKFEVSEARRGFVKDLKAVHHILHLGLHLAPPELVGACGQGVEVPCRYKWLRERPHKAGYSSDPVASKTVPSKTVPPPQKC